MNSEFENTYMSIGRNVEKCYLWLKLRETWVSGVIEGGDHESGAEIENTYMSIGQNVEN
jgi:hypothetical protein